MPGTMKSGRLPLVRLSLVEPFVAELERRGVDPTPVVEGVGLTREMFEDPEAFVHAMVVHRFLEDAAEAAGDRCFGATVGETLDLGGWPPLVEATREAATLGDFLSRFIQGAHQQASSTTQRLELQDDWAILGEERVSKPSILPAQNDAFMVSMWMAVLRRAMGDRWDPTRVTIWVCDPAVLPEKLTLMRVLKGDRLGFRLRFPTDWLGAPFVRESFDERSQEETRQDAPAVGFVEALRQALRPHLHEAGLTAERAAGVCRMNRHTLGRRLARHDTTLSAEIQRLKCDEAKRALEGSDRAIGDIAAGLGFGDPANFARSFKRWTGVSPREYRRSSRQ